MRITTLILISVCTAFGVQAQSKKVKNKQLLAELQIVQKTADSIREVHSDLLRGIYYYVDTGSKSARRISEQKREEINLRSEIKSNHSTLIKMAGFDANSLVSLEEVKNFVPPSIDKIYPEKPDWLNKNITLIQVAPMKDLTDVKIKTQNQLLRLKIDEYKSSNEKNMVLLSEEQTILKNWIKISDDYSAIANEYLAFNKKLEAKALLLADKYKELTAKKEEEDRLKLEKQLALEAKKNKGKKPKFVEPVIVDQEDEVPQESVEYGENTKVSSDFNYGAEFSAPPPEPMVEYENPAVPVIYDIVEQLAEFPGGREAMNKFLADNLKMPAVAKEMSINGKVYLKFVVSESGNISNVSVKKGIADCPECDAEAVRVVKKMPDWIPAKNNGKVVNCWYTMPILFKVQ